MTRAQHLVTTLGKITSDQVGWMLAHEHLFANFAADDDCGVATEAVIARMLPEIKGACRAGITVLVDATAVGAARRADVLLALSRSANFPVLVATGLFKEPAKSYWVAKHSFQMLCNWMIGELNEGIGEARVQAGWIKLSVANEGVQPHEIVLLQAAACASQITGAAVGSHTVGGKLAHEQLDIFEEAGGAPNRFIWIHTQTEPDVNVHIAFARRGAWIEYDAIDEDRPDDAYLDFICQIVDAGLEDHLLLSHDRVGFNPAQPNGGSFKPYTYLIEKFIPKMRTRGISGETIDKLLRVNPFRAYAR